MCLDSAASNVRNSQTFEVLINHKLLERPLLFLKIEFSPGLKGRSERSLRVDIESLGEGVGNLVSRLSLLCL